MEKMVLKIESLPRDRVVPYKHYKGLRVFRLSWKWTSQNVRVRNLEKKEREEEVHS